MAADPPPSDDDVCYFGGLGFRRLERPPEPPCGMPSPPANHASASTEYSSTQPTTSAEYPRNIPLLIGLDTDTVEPSPGVDCRPANGSLSAGNIRRIFDGIFEMPCAEWYTSVDSRRLSTVELKSKAFLAVDSGACRLRVSQQLNLLLVVNCRVYNRLFPDDSRKIDSGI